jgi:HK97 family phage major capsid protein/HK97 family phage prohead protease
MRPRPYNPFALLATLTRDAGNTAKQAPSPDGDMVYRMFGVEPDTVDKDKRTAEFSFSSDIELERWPGVIEVLSHDAGAVDLSRLRSGAPLLFNHSPDDYVGVVESANIGADRKGRCVVRFSENEDADKIWRDVQAGILRNVSVGYRIKEVKLTEERENGTDVYTVAKWEPYEVSIVTIPADISVGIGRNARSLFTKPNNSSHRNIMNRAQIIAMLRQLNVSFAETATDDELSALLQRSLPANPPQPAPTPAPAAQRSVQVVNEPTAADGTKTERDRVRSIFEAGRQYDAQDLAQEAVEKGQSLEQFRTALVDHLDKRNKSVVDGTKQIGMTEKEARGFSFIKLFRHLAAEPDQKARTAKDCEFELEACRTAADQLTHRSAKGTVIPTDVLLMPLAGQRADTIVGAKTASGYTNAGTNSIQTLLLTSSFIDLLRNRSFLMRVVSELSGLVGNIDIPKQLTGPAASWIGEDEAAESTGITFGLVSLRPKTLSARGELTRKLLMQNSLGVEALFRRDLATVMALEIDRAGIYGTNLNNQPKGLTIQSGINTSMWATDDQPTFAELVQMETEIAADNADVEGMAYAFNARMRGHLKTTRKFSDGNDGTIWEAGNTVNGYRTEVSNALANGDVVFGNWQDVLLGMWGGLDVTVDPYTHSDKGRIRITQFQDVDFTIRRAESFSYFKTNPA